MSAGPGGDRRPHPPAKPRPGVSFRSERLANAARGADANQAAGGKRQPVSSDGRAVDTGSLEGHRSVGRVFDEEGKDVTPRPLFHPGPNTAVPRLDEVLASSGDFEAAAAGFLSSFSACQASGTTAGSGSASGTCGSTSVLKASTAESTPDEAVDIGAQQDAAIGLPDVQVRQEEIKEEPAKEDLDKRVEICLMETETLWLLNVPPALVSVESEDAGRVLERNKMYVDKCENRFRKIFGEKIIQTFHGAAKNKELQCDKVSMEDKGTTSSPTVWPNAILAGSQKEDASHSTLVLASEKFHQDLFFLERVLMQNIFQPKLAAYRQLPVLTDPDVTSGTGGAVAAMEEAEQKEHDKEKDKEEQKEAFTDPPVPSDRKKTLEEVSPPRLEQLWSYLCDLTDGHNVSDMAWNKVNPDLLAVGYGAFDFQGQRRGLACCWSLKNPKWPERIFRCEFGVTALDFSVASPNLLAVGMYNGSVMVYDVRSCSDAALLDSRDSSESPTRPVWQLRWVEQDRGAAGGDKRERLLCISADGRVTRWFIQKRLDCTDLMKIKRTKSKNIKSPGGKGRKIEEEISPLAAGMCFDFHPKDAKIYLAGTEEGLIHRYSCSYQDSVLETYRGHKGPVYKVAWNPFDTDTFLSCSADWSVMLWDQRAQAPVLTFSSAAAFVNDIVWSPKSGSIFAAANESSVEIWDLSISKWNPMLSCSAKLGVKFTSVLFAKNTDCLLVGDSRGEVGVFQLPNLAAPGGSKPRA